MQQCPEKLAALRIEAPQAWAGFEISRYEKGVRIPAHRHAHLLLLWVLVHLDSTITVDEANAWLESGLQGWLTDRERQVLFELGVKNS